MRTPHQQPAEAVISLKVQRELWSHRGEWAAIDGDRVVAYGATPRQVLRRAAHKGSLNPLLHRVPEDGDNTYIL
jgi:hypothetical protein